MTIVNSALFAPHKNLLHAFTSRLNGLSMYGNNLAYHVNDRPEDVDANHKKLAEYLNYPNETLVHMNQVHGDEIIVIKKNHNFMTIPTCDALITQEKNVPLMVMVADCIPVLIYDPIQEVIGAVHAGRSGVFKKIIPKTIRTMQKEYHCKTKDLLVSIGPSIHQCCYKVGDEIKKEAEILNYGFAIKTIDNRFHLDILSIATIQLKKIGIRNSNIERSNLCTACNTDRFYSYRAENNQCGRFSGVIMLK